MASIVYITFLILIVELSNAIHLNSTSKYDEVTKLIHEFGYDVEIHDLITSDGYVLRIHRLKFPESSNELDVESKSPVLMLHGLFSSSGQFVHLGPKVNSCIGTGKCII